MLDFLIKIIFQVLVKIVIHWIKTTSEMCNMHKRILKGCMEWKCDIDENLSTLIYIVTPKSTCKSLYNV